MTTIEDPTPIRRIENWQHQQDPRFTYGPKWGSADMRLLGKSDSIDMDGLVELVNEVVAQMDKSGTRQYVYKPTPLEGQSAAFTIDKDGDYVFADPEYAQRVKRVDVAWDEKPVQYRKRYLIKQTDDNGDPILDANGDQVVEVVYGIKLEIRPLGFTEQADLLVGAFPVKLRPWATPNGRRIITEILRQMGGRDGRERKARVERLLAGAAEHRERMDEAKHHHGVNSLLDRMFGFEDHEEED